MNTMQREYPSTRLPGVERLCEALQMEADDRRILLLAWRTQAKRMGFFEMSEWLQGTECGSVVPVPMRGCVHLHVHLHVCIVVPV